MTFERQFVVTKLNELDGYAEELNEFLTRDDVAILKNIESVRAVERVFQLAVDAMLDINKYLINELSLAVPEDFQSTFYTLGENNVLPKEFAGKIAPIVGLRNRIVHGYETVNKK